MTCRRAALGLVAFSVLWAVAWQAPAPAADPPGRPAVARPRPNSDDEPRARAFSAARAAEFLDASSLAWTRDRDCGSCHTNYPYLMARPALPGRAAAPAHDEIRRFFEQRVSRWDGIDKGDAPRWDAEVVATAAVLALHDARTTGRLHPLTRRALDRMWTLQRKDGAWTWLKCGWPPMEHDDYYGAVLAAVGLGHAPEGYAASDKARPGVDRLRDYLRRTPPPDPHHRAMLLWASTRLDGLMTEADRQAAVKELLAAQRPDGGWCLPSLGKYKRRDGTPNDPASPADGYATGLAVFVLRQAGVPAADPRLRQAVGWLKANQRESGRWFTRSLNNDRAHYITHAGTAFAVLALDACGELDHAPGAEGAPGL